MEKEIKKSFYIFDLDGTVSDCQHRLFYVDRNNPINIKNKYFKPDWKTFFQQCVKDKPIYPTIEIMRGLSLLPNVEIRIWSARSEDVRSETEEWLRENEVPYASLSLRKTKDFRKDVLVKHDFLSAFFKGGNSINSISAVFEDRADMVKYWESIGLVCFKISEFSTPIIDFENKD